jgi:hypothetical protein
MSIVKFYTNLIHRLRRPRLIPVEYNQAYAEMLVHKVVRAFAHLTQFPKKPFDSIYNPKALHLRHLPLGSLNPLTGRPSSEFAPSNNTRAVDSLMGRTGTYGE